jgi:hypothetical protein
MHNTPTTILKRDALGRIGCSRGQREARWRDIVRRQIAGRAGPAALAVTVPVTLEIDLGVTASLMRLC